MNRAALLKSLANFKPNNQEKKEIINHLILFIELDTNCFSRNNIKGHVTGSAWLTNDKDQVLLTHHKILNKWLQLGGHCDGQSDVLEVAKKEAFEESGIQNIQAKNNEIFDIDIHFIPANKMEDSHFHYDIRYHLETKASNITISNESNDLKWFKKKELISGLIKIDQSMKNMVNIWVLQ